MSEETEVQETDATDDWAAAMAEQTEVDAEGAADEPADDIVEARDGLNLEVGAGLAMLFVYHRF